MSLIGRTLNSQQQPTLLYGGAVETLADSLSRGECLPFLGAGASVDDAAPRDLPQGWELAKSMSEQIGLEWHKQGRLSTAAFYYEFFRGGRQALNRLLQKEIGNPQIRPSAAVRKLVGILRIPESVGRNIVVATTNYDQQFEHAYEEEYNRRPGVVVYEGAWNPLDRAQLSLNIGLRGELDAYGIGWYPSQGTTLYKIHGCISRATGNQQNLVITDEDYINFLANSVASGDPERRLLTHFTARLQRCRILFIGYSLEDWNFRVVFKSTAEQRKDTEFSYAVQYYPSDRPRTDEERVWLDATANFWHEKRVHILNVKASDFMDDLAAMLPKVEAAAR